MAYEADSYADEIHLYAAGHEHPAALKPQVHVFHGEALPWMDLNDGLERFERLSGDSD